MSSDAVLNSWLRLTLISGIGGATQRKLLSTFGLPEAIFSAPRSALREVFSEKIVNLLLDTDTTSSVESALIWAENTDQHIITLADPEYPQSLLQIPDPPTLIYVRGRLDLLNQPALAIVGSRYPTPEGLYNAERFAAALAEAGLVISSGLALGVDAAAHRGALSVSGLTIVFIGTGIDRVYPARNRELALEIGAKGTIVSEFPIGTPASAANFPRRNRLISGIARGVLVIEASVDSGSLITSRLAAEQGREVFAIPGSIHSPVSRGCHKLIKQGAKLVETAQDVLEELDLPHTARIHSAVTPTHSEDTDQLLSQIGYDPCGIDELVVRCGLTAELLSVKLLNLELNGRVITLPGGFYKRLP